MNCSWPTTFPQTQARCLVLFSLRACFIFFIFLFLRFFRFSSRWALNLRDPISVQDLRSRSPCQPVIDLVLVLLSKETPWILEPVLALSTWSSLHPWKASHLIMCSALLSFHDDSGSPEWTFWLSLADLIWFFDLFFLFLSDVPQSWCLLLLLLLCSGPFASVIYLLAACLFFQSYSDDPCDSWSDLGWIWSLIIWSHFWISSVDVAGVASLLISF